MNPPIESVYKRIDASNLRIVAEELDRWAKSLGHMALIDMGASTLEGRYTFSVLIWKPERRPDATTH